MTFRYYLHNDDIMIHNNNNKFVIKIYNKNKN
jgi:hypothetical protein